MWTVILKSFYNITIIYSYFTPVLADCLSRESERKQVFSNLQDSSQYSGPSQECFSLDGLHSSSYFQVLQSLYQSFADCTKSTNYNWNHRHFHFPRFFQFPSKVRVLNLFSLSFNFTRCSAGTAKSTILQVLFFFLFFFFINIRSGSLAEIRWSVCISKSQRSLCVSFSRTDSGLCIYYLS